MVPDNTVYVLNDALLPGALRFGQRRRVPTRTEQQLCRPYLDAEIALIDPALILPVAVWRSGCFIRLN